MGISRSALCQLSAAWTLEDHDLPGWIALRRPDGPTGGRWPHGWSHTFLAYVESFLCPAPAPGDIVIADHPGSHKVTGVRRAIEAVGATLRYLPPYSPDLNPIETLFARLKTLLRKAAIRTVDALWEYIGTLIEVFTPEECLNYFTSCGYVNK